MGPLRLLSVVLFVSRAFYPGRPYDLSNLFPFKVFATLLCCFLLHISWHCCTMKSYAWIIGSMFIAGAHTNGSGVLGAGTLLVECLLNVYKALASIPSTTQTGHIHIHHTECSFFLFFNVCTFEWRCSMCGEVRGQSRMSVLKWFPPFCLKQDLLLAWKLFTQAKKVGLSASRDLSPLLR